MYNLNFEYKFDWDTCEVNGDNWLKGIIKSPKRKIYFVFGTKISD